jgi:hypothetical protein
MVNAIREAQDIVCNQLWVLNYTIHW